MKKYILLLTATVVISLMTSCGGKEDKPRDITGIWNLTSVQTRSAQSGGQTVDVYISFVTGGTFQMYQKIGAGRYRSFSGTWTLTDNVLTGKYSDGTSWGATYEADVQNDGTSLVLTSQGANPETDTYTKVSSIPESVTSSAR